jgi:hypothetical protein
MAIAPHGVGHYPLREARDLDELLPSEDSANFHGVLCSSTNNIRNGSSGYRSLLSPVGGISMTHKSHRVLPHRVHVASLADFRRVKWALVPLYS